MMGIRTIRGMSRRAARQAAEKLKTPLLVAAEDMDNVKEHLRYMPFIGDYVPTGYELVEAFFVDMTGMDEAGPALSQKVFFSKVKVGSFYAVIEVGQLQMHIGEFKKV